MGFTDAEGNFNICLRNFQNMNYNSCLLTFQIGLHIADLNTLQYIKAQLRCGHISISHAKCNYFINDQISLIHVILPIFNCISLNSSKYFQYQIFQDAVKLLVKKQHLTVQGRLLMITYYNQLKLENNQGLSNYQRPIIITQL